MKISHSLTTHFFTSWDRESDFRTKLVVLITGGAVTLAFTPAYMSPVSVEMTQAEANELSRDIFKLLENRVSRAHRNVPAQGETCRTDQVSQLVISVKTTTQGEPYEEGMILAFRQPDFTEVADIELSYDTARSLAKALQVEELAAKED